MTRTNSIASFLATFLLISAASLCASEPPSTVAEWPQFHGPRRENRSEEKGLLKSWPEGGPKLVWRAEGIGEGYSSVAIAGGMLYVAGNIDGKTIITALDLAGKKLWQAENGPAYDRQFPGARGTPTIVEGKLYHLNGDGDVICLEAQSGRKIWTRNILKDFDGRNIQWGLAESVLVDGQKVVCCPGGKEVGMVALDKDTGKTLWTCTGIGEKPAYTSAIVVEHGGLRQIVTLMAESAVGVAAETGRLLWKYPHPAPYDVNVSTPIHSGGRLALFATWGRGATQLKLNVSGEQCSVEKLWHSKDLDNEHGGVVLVDGYLYGLADGNHKQTQWACLDWETGKTMHTAKSLPSQRSGSLTYADGMLYIVNDKGTIQLVPADPKEHRIEGSFRLPEGGQGPTWAHPVICGGRLYLRHDKFLYVYGVREKSPDNSP